MRAEFEWAEVPYPQTLSGSADAKVDDDDHGPHVFLYIPDLSAQTGWSSHRVPEGKAPQRNERKPMGFRR